METMVEKARLTVPQLLLLDDLYCDSLWVLNRGEHRPMKRLIEIGFATKTGGEWKITPQGRRYFKDEVINGPLEAIRG